MVSRGIATSDILKGIHLSMAARLVKLLRSTKAAEGVVLMTGGLALDTGLLKTLAEAMAGQKSATEVRNHPDSIYAGAIGAALWGEFRYRRLAELDQLPLAS